MFVLKIREGVFCVRGNLFVVSRVGQLRNAQSFIKEYGATHNHLAVLYTDSNLVLRDNIGKNVEPGLFEEIVYVKQPLKPLAQSGKKNTIIYGQIENLLVKMSTQREVDSLFLCNSDNYYSLFEKVIKERGLAFSVNLLEEGLGTYANAGQKYYTLNKSVDWSEVKHRGRHLRKTSLQALRSLLTLLLTLVSWVLRVDLLQYVKGAFVRMFVKEKYRYGNIAHFDTAYVYFPDKIYSNNMEIDRVESLGFVLEPSAPKALLDTVGDGLVVFVSQAYIPYEPYFSIVFEILSEMGLEKVLFKFHPREDRTAIAKAWDLALKEHPRLQVSRPLELQAVPVEELMMAGKAKLVIGLTSTSLMYGKAFFPGVDVVSIGARFRELADSDEYDISIRALAEFNRDLDVFLDVSGVRQF
jgi:hypothetical protein